MTSEEKLDTLLEHISEMRGDLRAHLAVDEYMWKQVRENEGDIKALIKENGKLKAKHAALAASIATATGGVVHVLAKVLL